MKNGFEYPRDFKGIFIPKEVWLDDKLSAIDKFILEENNYFSLLVKQGAMNIWQNFASAVYPKYLPVSAS